MSMWTNLHRITSYPTCAFYLLIQKERRVSVIFLTDMTGAVAMSSYALPGLHFEPTPADLQASSTAYVIHNLSHMICCETRRTLN